MQSQAAYLLDHTGPDTPKRMFIIQGPAGLAVQPLDLHLVNVGSIPTGVHSRTLGTCLNLPRMSGRAPDQARSGGEAERSPNTQRSSYRVTPSGILRLPRPSSRPTSKVAETLQIPQTL